MFRGFIVCVIAAISGFCSEPPSNEEGWYPVSSLPAGNWKRSASVETDGLCSGAADFVKIEENGEISEHLFVMKFEKGSPLFQMNKTFLSSLPEDPRKMPLGIADEAMIENVNEENGHRIFLKFFRYHDNYLAVIYSTNEKKDVQALRAQADDYLSKCKYTGLLKRGQLNVEGKVVTGEFQQTFREKIGIFVPDDWSHGFYPDKSSVYLRDQTGNSHIELLITEDHRLNQRVLPKIASDWGNQGGMKVEKKVNLSIKNAKGSGFRLRGMHPHEDKHALIGYCTKDGRKILETIFYKGEKDPLIEAVMDTLEFLD